MSVDRFDVLIRNNATRQTIKREWTKAELLKSVAWLKRMNARGSEVYVKPAGQHGLILIHALKAQHLAAMRRKGFEPTVTVELRPGEFQAWVRLSADPVTDKFRHLTADGLARTIGGAAAGAGEDGYGRLAGFTVQQTATDPRIRRRFVLVHEAVGTVASSGEKYLEHIEKVLVDRIEKRDQGRSSEQARAKNRGRGR